jgi:hypothetical protein
VESVTFQPVWTPMPDGFPLRGDRDGLVTLKTWAGDSAKVSPYALGTWLVRACWVNYFLAALNIALWPWWGYRQATLAAIFAGFAVVFIVGLYSIILSSVLALCLALFIYFACQRQWILLETGGEEGIFGYDFSQGYTSLERDHVQAAPSKPRLSWWRRWLQKRAARRLQRELEQREAEERRMDELLDKLHRQGREALTEEEQRFMKRVSDRYRNNRR